MLSDIQDITERLVRQYAAVDIDVYTPDEVRHLFSLGSPAVLEVMEKGRLLHMRKSTAAWIRDSQEELETASILREHRKFRGACFHSQQCVEKGLKALLLERGKSRPARTTCSRWST